MRSITCLGWLPISTSIQRQRRQWMPFSGINSLRKTGGQMQYKIFCRQGATHQFLFLKKYQLSCRAQFNKISMHGGLKLSQQSRNRKLQVAGPRKYSAARNKDTLFSIKAKRLNRLNDLQRSNYPLTDIKSIYAAFKVVITSFLLSVRIYEDIFSLR